MQKTHDEHYLRAVTELGDTRKMVVDRDIYAQSGIKLVAAGVRVTSGLYDRLAQHKLLPQLDMSLSVENMLDVESIADDVSDLLRTNENLAGMAAIIDKGSSLRRMILAVQLPTPVAFKLTVAREKYRHIYQHSLVLLVVSAYLAHCDGMDLHQEELVVAAALLHDIGLLHIDPRLLEPSHMMSVEERRHLYAHPLTAYVFLCEISGLSRQVVDAVLEHHERMDGSGYPRGLPGEKISRLGQILAVAEAIAKAFDSGQPMWQWKKLEVMLKLNSRQYGQGLTGHLNMFWGGDDASGINDVELLMSQVRLIAQLFEDFNRHSGSAHSDKIFDFAQLRLIGLRLELFDAGFDPRDPEGLIRQFTDEPECMADYAPLLNETLWQFNALVLEISRRWPEATQDDHAAKPELVWLHEMQALLQVSSQDA